MVEHLDAAFKVPADEKRVVAFATVAGAISSWKYNDEYGGGADPLPISTSEWRLKKMRQRIWLGSLRRRRDS